MPQGWSSGMQNPDDQNLGVVFSGFSGMFAGSSFLRPPSLHGELGVHGKGFFTLHFSLFIFHFAFCYVVYSALIFT
ncbi:MAG: hypothetical protein KAR36_06955, partial [Candidatus Latescibacteria bacterium]|nr:hypothetical protein [Candidatus Latescibacterota bacterium]